MLLLGSRLISIPVLGLQTGTKLATARRPIVDPNNLKILAYEVDGAMLADHPSFLMINDIRELSDIGMIIDSSDEFIGRDDVIAIKKIYDLNFNVIGLNVIDQNKKKLGKIIDFSLDTDSFVIQQLNVRPGVIKSLAKTDFLVNRSQIIEINDYAVIVRSTHVKSRSMPRAKDLPYINPFRSTTAV